MERDWKRDPGGTVGKSFLEQVVVHRMTGRCWPGNERRHSGVGFWVKALVPRIENTVK